MTAGWIDRALSEHEQQAAGRNGSPQPLPGTVREELVLERIDRVRRARPRVREDRITMSHGAGGKATQSLIEAIFLDAFRNPLLEPLEDAARLEIGGARVALTTDSYVVSPLFFPGGNIGDLAVNGTVNDLAMAGAVPLYLSAGFILEEGFEVERPGRDHGVDARGGPGRRRADRDRRYQGGREGQGRRLLHQHRGRRAGRAGREHRRRDRSARRCDPGVRADRRPRGHDHAGQGRAGHRG